MREIKFRAWDKENKFMSDVVMWHLKNGIVNTSDVRLEDGYIEEELEIMQYTGLKDKNGKEIYEGDIVKCYAREKWAIETGIDSKLVLYGTGEVIWFENECGFGIKGQDPTFLGWYECFEIVGNIYDNPELLSK